MGRRILLVCSGNTCRSPMAERLLAARARALGLDLVVSSAGLSALEGEPATPEARAALRRRQLDAEGHRARRLTEELVREADLVLTMTSAHKQGLLARFPEAAGKVFTLGEFAEGPAGGDVEDPYGRGEEAYEQCAARLERLVEQAVQRLAAEGAGPGQQPAECGT
jgi:protein-tyrosine phosphatase